MEQLQRMDRNTLTRTMIIGGVLGALIGISAAYLWVSRNLNPDEPRKMTAGDGVKVGLGVLGLLRLVADIGQEEKK
jgi:hypothetical protein